MSLGIDWKETTAVLRCENCGSVSLTEEQYVSQLWEAFARWHCPRCGRPADWDDASDITREG